MNANEKIRLAKSLLVSHADLRPFICDSQRAALADCLRGEEREHFADMLIELRQRISFMPVTYQTDGQGKNALVQLHYFLGSANFWITEKDMDGGVEQAFGWANMYGGAKEAECGYIGIRELVENGVELDLYWNVKPFAEC